MIAINAIWRLIDGDICKQQLQQCTPKVFKLFACATDLLSLRVRLTLIMTDHDLLGL